MQFVAGEMHLTIFMDEPIPHYAQDFQYLQLLPSTANDHGGYLVIKIESSDRDWCFYGKDQISIRI